MEPECRGIVCLKQLIYDFDQTYFFGELFYQEKSCIGRQISAIKVYF